MSMRMFLRSSDDATLFDNKPYDFNVQLDKQTPIEGNWVVALTEIKVNYTGTTKQVKDLYVYTNVCTGSIVGKSEKPLIRRVHIDTNNTSKTSNTLSSNVVFDTPYYVPVRVKDLDQIRIYIKDEKKTRTVHSLTEKPARRYISRDFFSCDDSLRERPEDVGTGI